MLSSVRSVLIHPDTKRMPEYSAITIHGFPLRRLLSAAETGHLRYTRRLVPLIQRRFQRFTRPSPMYTARWLPVQMLIFPAKARTHGLPVRQHGHSQISLSTFSVFIRHTRDCRLTPAYPTTSVILRSHVSSEVPPTTLMLRILQMSKRVLQA